jgi:hypothetical protein
MNPQVDPGELDRILATQLLVAWAGETGGEPKRLGWWETDLIDDAGGGDLIARLAPKTHAWASLELVREAARKADAVARGKHGHPDALRTLFFLGFEVDEKLADRLAELKRQGKPPEEALPLPFKLSSTFDPEKLREILANGGPAPFEKVPPVGRQLKGTLPESLGDKVAKLASALVPIANAYPLPFYKVGS